MTFNIFKNSTAIYSFPNRISSRLLMIFCFITNLKKQQMAGEFFKISNRNSYLWKNTDDFASNITYLPFSKASLLWHESVLSWLSGVVDRLLPPAAFGTKKLGSSISIIWSSYVKDAPYSIITIALKKRESILYNNPIFFDFVIGFLTASVYYVLMVEGHPLNYI